MTSAFEAAGNFMADSARAQFGFAATDVSSLKLGVVAGIKQSLSLSNGLDAAPGMKFDI